MINMKVERHALASLFLSCMFLLSAESVRASNNIGVQTLTSLGSVGFGSLTIQANLANGSIIGTRYYDILIGQHSTAGRSGGYVEFPSDDNAELRLPPPYEGLALKVTGKYSLPVTTAVIPFLQGFQPKVELLKVGDVSLIPSGSVTQTVNAKIGWKVPGCNGTPSLHPIGIYAFNHSYVCDYTLQGGTANHSITITFIIDKVINKCEFSVPSMVSLPTIPASTLVSGTAGDTFFNIHFRKCEGSINAVKISLNATTASDSTIATGAGSAASNVGIQILYNGSPIRLDNTDLIQVAGNPIASFDPEMTVRYKSTGGTPNAGMISIPVNFTVHYE